MTADLLAQAEAAWSLAPLLAARRSVRLWSPGAGFDRARRLGRRLPGQPAAIPIFDRHGRTTLLALDFDPKHLGRDQVVRDVDQAVRWIRSAGGRVIVDESTRGGRHVLVPLAAGVDLAVRHLRPVLDELARRLPTLDITPMTNLATGCITAPGSPCKEGGHRRLLTPLDEAITVATTRSAPGTIARLASLLGLFPSHATMAHDLRTPAHLPDAATTDDRAVSDSSAAAGSASPPCPPPPRAEPEMPGPQSALPVATLAFAVHGVLPDRRNRHGERWTRHEARQSVLAHAAVRGMTLLDVLAKMTTGQWPGLRVAYDRYGHRWVRAVRSDWNKALTWAHTAGSIFRLSAHEQQHTGGSPAGKRSVCEWLARAERWIVLCDQLDGHSRWSALAVCQALAFAAQLTSAPTIEPGVRWLSVAAGMLSEETVADMLRHLRDLAGSPVLLVRKGVGAQADRYALVTPNVSGVDVPVVAGILARVTTDPVHPAWSVLGLPAYRVFTLLLDHAGAMAGRAVRPLDLPAATGMSRSQVYHALTRLGEHGLIERGHGWVRRTTRTLTDVAVDQGVDALRAQRVERHRRERRAWHALLAQWEGEPSSDCPAQETVLLADDPWRPDEREDYLAAVMATGPPSADDLPENLGGSANPDLFDQVPSVADTAIALLADVLAARVVG